MSFHIIDLLESIQPLTLCQVSGILLFQFGSDNRNAGQDHYEAKRAHFVMLECWRTGGVGTLG